MSIVENSLYPSNNWRTHVRQHQRRTKSGRYTTVTQHDRRLLTTRRSPSKVTVRNIGKPLRCELCGKYFDGVDAHPRGTNICHECLLKETGRRYDGNRESDADKSLFWLTGFDKGALPRTHVLFHEKMGPVPVNGFSDPVRGRREYIAGWKAGKTALRRKEGG